MREQQEIASALESSPSLLADAEALLAARPDDSASRKWPEPLAEQAFRGVAGQTVRAIEPNSEADPAALLVQMLLAFGSVIGRSAHFRVEADRHYCNLFAVLVGVTSEGRKGTSWGTSGELLSRQIPIGPGRGCSAGFRAGRD